MDFIDGAILVSLLIVLLPPLALIWAAFRLKSREPKLEEPSIYAALKQINRADVIKPTAAGETPKARDPLIGRDVITRDERGQWMH